MKKQRIFTTLAGLAFCIGMMAQVKAARVESPIVTEKDFVWYVEQKNAWRDITQKEPQNEAAWLNYYNAARYMGWFGQPSDSLARQAMKEMREAIPNTYTYNMCAYMSVKLGLSDETDGDPYAEAAMTMQPDEMQLNDYNEWVCYLAMKGQEQRMAQMTKRFFDSGLYSEAVLRYSYNELAGMDEGGIYLGSGDAAIIPKWLIQEGMGLHRDKTIVCVPFLAVKEYREWLSQKLNVVFPAQESSSYASYDAFEQSLLQVIIDRYGSKVYFSCTTPQETTKPWQENLYNEGLLLKYSKKAYDNLAVKRRNVEDRYLLEYLLVSFRPEWTTGQRMAANYAVLLADLLPYYAQHDQRRYDWLMKLLVSGVMNTSLDEQHKQSILQQLVTVTK